MSEEPIPSDEISEDDEFNATVGTNVPPPPPSLMDRVRKAIRALEGFATDDGEPEYDENGKSTGIHWTVINLSDEDGGSDG